MTIENINIEELSDSREIMLKKAPKSIRIFIYSLCLFIVSALVWAWFWEIDIYITAKGEVRPVAGISTVFITNSGKIDKIYYKNGEHIRCGDVILKIDCSNYEKQKQNLEDEICKKEKDIVYQEKLLKKVEQNTIDNGQNLNYINLHNSIDKLSNEINTLKLQLDNVSDIVNNSNIVSNAEGYLLLDRDYVIGDFIQSETKIGTIIPSKEDFKVILYVPEQFISGLHVGQQIKCSSRSIYKTCFYKINGTVIDIANDSFTDTNTYQTYYKVQAELSSNNSNDSSLALKNGMIMEGHIITGKQTIWNYLFSKLFVF